MQAWWKTTGNWSRAFQVGPTQMLEYIAGVGQMVQALRDEFPQRCADISRAHTLPRRDPSAPRAGSRILWRTLHPGFKHSITSGVTHMLNAAIRAHAHSMGPLELLDAGEMIEGLPVTPRVPVARIDRIALHTFGIPTAAYGTYDGRHLYEWLDLEVFNLMLNVLWQAHARPKHRAKGRGGE